MVLFHHQDDFHPRVDFLVHYDKIQCAVKHRTKNQETRNGGIVHYINLILYKRSFDRYFVHACDTAFESEESPFDI